MLTASPSPQLDSRAQNDPSCLRSPHLRNDGRPRSVTRASPIVKPYPSHVYAVQETPSKRSPQCSPPERRVNPTIPYNTSLVPQGRPEMVDAATQYSPPIQYRSPTPLAKSQTTTSHPPRPSPTEPRQVSRQPPDTAASSTSFTSHLLNARMPTCLAEAPQSITDSNQKVKEQSTPTKRQLSRFDVANQPEQSSADEDKAPSGASISEQEQEQNPASKRLRPDGPPVRIMPVQYENCDTNDLVILISSMLMELIRFNDTIPLQDGRLTRFHSRAPPGISVIDYLRRLTTHATLSPPILLSMVYYIDILGSFYPAFTISSLTVHRFLITSATVASKGLSDSFWTNRIYARVGGVNVKELALLELEFLVRVQWRIVPKPEVLVDYYRSLVERSPGYEMEKGMDGEDSHGPSHG